jgi:tetraacyldisaccharide 4'-kinase
MNGAWLHDILSGRRRGAGPALLRFATRLAEPFYSGAMIARNTLFNARILPSHHLPVPVISVGNITAGGTGKTPVVLWLAQHLRDAGLHPAILMRGYKRDQSQISDEEEMLRHALNDDGASPPVIVHAQPDRVAGGRRVLREHPDVNVFILDDGFQHRRLRRQFDLVLIDALNPFGYDHVHPRGLLREPLRALSRADAFMLTRSDQVSTDERRRIATILRMHNPTAPLYEARHAHTELIAPDATRLSLDKLQARRFFAFAGIANPLALEQQLSSLPGVLGGHHWFPDHHPYTERDVLTLREQAQATNADLLLTTEKDWPKLHPLPASTNGAIPIYRLSLKIHLEPQAATGLLQLIHARIESKRNDNEVARASRP